MIRERDVLAVVSDGVVATDTAGRIEALNPAAEQLTGWSGGEALGRVAGEVVVLVDEDSRVALPCPALEALRTGAEPHVTGDAVLVRRDGTGLPVGVRCVPLRAATGAVTGAALVLRDRTGELAARRASQQEAILQSVDHLTSAMIYQVIAGADGSRTFTFVSDAVRRLYGATPAAALADPRLIYDRIHPEDRARLQALEVEAITTSSVFTATVRVIGPAGNVRWSTFVSSPRRLEDGSIRWDGVDFDVTEHKRVEAALEAKSAELDSFFSSALDLLCIADTDGHFLRLNAEWERTLGYPLDELLGRPFIDLVHPDDKPRTRAALARLAAGEPLADFANRYVCQDGTPRWIEWRAIANGPVIFAAARDITERKRTEELLRESGRRKDEFLAMLSHELRNPLAPIRNSLYVLERAAPDSDEAHRALAVVERQTAHLTHLVDDLLDITRITRGKITLRREPVDLGALVQRTLDDHRGEFAKRRIAVVADVDEEPCWTDADPTRLAQVVGNLLSNALKFTPAGGRVAVEVRREGARVTLRVRDTGVGIAKATLDTLFAPFAQAAQPLDRSSGGLGLGLALVKGLVELHGGKVSAISAGTGRGAEFIIELLPTTAPATVTAAPAAPAARRPRRVLVIEDNVDAAESLKDLLELHGHVVEVAPDGPNGLTLARTFRPEVVLCDIGLPGMSGYEVAKAFRRDPDLRGPLLVALTGYARPEDRQRALDAGFTRHVAKPPSAETLHRVVSEAP